MLSTCLLCIHQRLPTRHVQAVSPNRPNALRMLPSHCLRPCGRVHRARRPVKSKRRSGIRNTFSVAVSRSSKSQRRHELARQHSTGQNPHCGPDAAGFFPARHRSFSRFWSCTRARGGPGLRRRNWVWSRLHAWCAT